MKSQRCSFTQVGQKYSAQKLDTIEQNGTASVHGVGLAEGDLLPLIVGRVDGNFVGTCVGFKVSSGDSVGKGKGISVGCKVGYVGRGVGAHVGRLDEVTTVNDDTSTVTDPDNPTLKASANDGLVKAKDTRDKTSLAEVKVISTKIS